MRHSEHSNFCGNGTWNEMQCVQYNLLAFSVAPIFEILLQVNSNDIYWQCNGLNRVMFISFVSWILINVTLNLFGTNSGWHVWGKYHRHPLPTGVVNRWVNAIRVLPQLWTMIDSNPDFLCFPLLFCRFIFRFELFLHRCSNAFSDFSFLSKCCIHCTTLYIFYELQLEQFLHIWQSFPREYNVVFVGLRMIMVFNGLFVPNTPNARLFKDASLFIASLVVLLSQCFIVLGLTLLLSIHGPLSWISQYLCSFYLVVIRLLHSARWQIFVVHSVYLLSFFSTRFHSSFVSYLLPYHRPSQSVRHHRIFALLLLSHATFFLQADLSFSLTPLCYIFVALIVVSYLSRWNFVAMFCLSFVRCITFVARLWSLWR